MSGLHLQTDREKVMQMCTRGEMMQKLWQPKAFVQISRFLVYLASFSHCADTKKLRTR